MVGLIIMINYDNRDDFVNEFLISDERQRREIEIEIDIN